MRLPFSPVGLVRPFGSLFSSITFEEFSCVFEEFSSRFSSGIVGFSNSFTIFATDSRFNPILVDSAGLVRRLLMMDWTLSFWSILICLGQLVKIVGEI